MNPDSLGSGMIVSVAAIRNRIQIGSSGYGRATECKLRVNFVGFLLSDFEDRPARHRRVVQPCWWVLERTDNGQDDVRTRATVMTAAADVADFLFDRPS
ncbi:hypothetical protein GC176_18665 [bacterium]|nr:hypothetical protein [bacterium]